MHLRSFFHHYIRISWLICSNCVFNLSITAKVRPVYSSFNARVFFCLPEKGTVCSCFSFLLIVTLHTYTLQYTLDMLLEQYSVLRIPLGVISAIMLFLNNIFTRLLHPQLPPFLCVSPIVLFLSQALDYTTASNRSFLMYLYFELMVKCMDEEFVKLFYHYNTCPRDFLTAHYAVYACIVHMKWQIICLL